MKKKQQQLKKKDWEIEFNFESKPLDLKLLLEHKIFTRRMHGVIISIAKIFVHQHFKRKISNKTYIS